MAQATLLPTGNGTYQEFTASAGNAYNCVSASGGEYVSVVIGPDQTKTSTFTFSDMPSAASINWVQIYGTYKSSSAINSIQEFRFRISSTDYDVVTYYDGVSVDQDYDTTDQYSNIITTYATWTRRLTTNPATSSAWLEAAVNAIEAGPKIIDGLSGSSTKYCDHLYIVVDYTPAPKTFTITDGILLGELVSLARVKSFIITEGIKLGDIISAVKGKVFSILDTLHIGDLISAVIVPITQWTNRTKPSTTFTNRTKPSTSFTDRTKPTTTWTKQDR